MHPDVVGSKGDICEKCGMPLGQLVVVVLVAQQAVRATISTDAPLEQGTLAHAVLHLRRGVNGSGHAG